MSTLYSSLLFQVLEGLILHQLLHPLRIVQDQSALANFMMLYQI